MIITTTANRVKRGPYWCEEADEITNSTLEGTEYDWDTELPIEWILQHGGLANTLLALGSVRPRFQAKADAMLRSYVKELYAKCREYAESLGLNPSKKNVAHWITDPNRKQALAIEAKKWVAVKSHTSDPEKLLVCDVMSLLFSGLPIVIKAIHGTKFFLGAYAIKHGFSEADIIKQDLRKIISDGLEKLSHE